MTWYPSIELIEVIFEKQIGYKVQYANKQNLESALDMIRWGIPTQNPLSIWEKAAILMRNITQFHVFADGCKRVGIQVSYIFLLKNGYLLNPKDPEEIFIFPMNVAKGILEFNDIATWFRTHSQSC